MNRARITALVSAFSLLALVAATGAWLRPQTAAERMPLIELETVARETVKIVEPVKRAVAVPEWPSALGSFDLTYYWLAAEKRKRKQADVQLYRSKGCRPLAKVTPDFAARARLEGAGRLTNGRIITLTGACSCPTSPCFRNARPGHRWGTGVEERPLSPFRSVAVDPKHVAIGSLLYIPELDGLTMPGRKPYGDFVHDGCVVADDRGGGVKGQKIDLFAAKKHHYRSLHRRHRLSKVTVFDGSQRCRNMGERVAARRGSM